MAANVKMETPFAGMKSRRRTAIVAIAREREARRKLLAEQCKRDLPPTEMEWNEEIAGPNESPFDEYEKSSASDSRCNLPIMTSRCQMPFDEMDSKNFGLVNFSPLVHVRSKQAKLREHIIDQMSTSRIKFAVVDRTRRRSHDRLAKPIGASFPLSRALKSEFRDQSLRTTTIPPKKEQVSKPILCSQSTRLLGAHDVTAPSARSPFPRESGPILDLPSDEESSLPSLDEQSNPSLDEHYLSSSEQNVQMWEENDQNLRLHEQGSLVELDCDESTSHRDLYGTSSLASEVRMFLLRKEISKKANQDNEIFEDISGQGLNKLISAPVARTTTTKRLPTLSKKFPPGLSWTAIQTSERIMKSLHDKSPPSEVENVVVWSASREMGQGDGRALDRTGSSQAWTSSLSTSETQSTTTDQQSYVHRDKPVGSIVSRIMDDEKAQSLELPDIVELPLNETLSGLEGGSVSSSITSQQRKECKTEHIVGRERTPIRKDETLTKSCKNEYRDLWTMFPAQTEGGKSDHEEVRAVKSEEDDSSPQRVWSFYDPQEINALSMASLSKKDRSATGTSFDNRECVAEALSCEKRVHITESCLTDESVSTAENENISLEESFRRHDLQVGKKENDNLAHTGVRVESSPSSFSTPNPQSNPEEYVPTKSTLENGVLSPRIQTTEVLEARQLILPQNVVLTKDNLNGADLGAGSTADSQDVGYSHQGPVSISQEPTTHQRDKRGPHCPAPKHNNVSLSKAGRQGYDDASGSVPDYAIEEVLDLMDKFQAQHEKSKYVFCERSLRRHQGLGGEVSFRAASPHNRRSYETCDNDSVALDRYSSTEDIENYESLQRSVHLSRDDESDPLPKNTQTKTNEVQGISKEYAVLPMCADTDLIGDEDERIPQACCLPGFPFRQPHRKQTPHPLRKESNCMSFHLLDENVVPALSPQKKDGSLLVQSTSLGTTTVDTRYDAIVESGDLRSMQIQEKLFDSDGSSHPSEPSFDKHPRGGQSESLSSLDSASLIDSLSSSSQSEDSGRLSKRGTLSERRDFALARRTGTDPYSFRGPATSQMLALFTQDLTCKCAAVSFSD